MKTILMPISNSFAVRNFLRSDFGQLMRLQPNTRLIFLAPDGKLPYYRKEFDFPNVDFWSLPDVTQTRAEKFFKLLECASIHTNTVRLTNRFYLKRKGTKTPIFVRTPVFLFRQFLWFLGGSKKFRSIIRFTYGRFHCRPFRVLLLSAKPDLVFCPTLIYGGEFSLLREAGRLKIKTVGMVSSWDNLYSKTFIRIFPDRLLVQTENLKRQAISLADYSASKITVTGVPQYDRHFRRSGVVSRDEFVRSFGGDPSKKIILYALSGKAGLDIDSAVLDILREAAGKKVWGENVQILIRPYPKRDFSEGRIEKIRRDYGFLTYGSAAAVGVGKDAWEFDETAIDLLLNTLAHSDVVISTYSTFFIEAAIFDKPIIAVAFDKDPKTDYWNSARRFFDWDHLQDIGRLNGITIIKKPEDFLTAISSALSEPDALAAGRRLIVKEQCGSTDGQSAKRVAEAVSLALDGGVS